MEESEQSLPDHVEETVRAIERLHSEHRDEATPVERHVDSATALFGRPGFVGVLILFVLCWVGVNLVLLNSGLAAFDVPPFPWLEDALTLTALFLAALILTTQRRADRLASHSEKMTLQLALVSEQKTAKIIELLEELRRDSPQIKDRVDTEADAMATRADPQAVSEAIRESHVAEPAANHDRRR
jgi:uncharacterized membrane protein